MQTKNNSYYWLEKSGEWSQVCQIDLYGWHPDQTIVLLTQINSDREGAIRAIASKLLPLICQDYGIDPELAIWIERYPYSRNDFREAEFLQILPTWKHNQVVALLWMPIAQGLVESWTRELL